jgi:hypothetical protein
MTAAKFAGIMIQGTAKDSYTDMIEEGRRAYLRRVGREATTVTLPACATVPDMAGMAIRLSAKVYPFHVLVGEGEY